MLFNLSNMENLGAKRAFDANVVEVHIPILDGLEELYHLLDTTFIQMIRYVRESGPESASNGVVSTGVLEDTYLHAVENRDSYVQDANVNYLHAYNEIGGMPNEYRPAGVTMPSTEMYDAILFNFGLHVRQMTRSLRGLSITFEPLTDLIEKIRIEVNRVRDHVLCYVGSEFVIPPNPEFAQQMRALRLARQTDLLAMSEYTIFGVQGGWCEIGQSYFDDLAFLEYLNLDDDQRQALVESLLRDFKDEDGNWYLGDIARLFISGGEAGFTTIELGALEQLFFEELSFEEIVRIYSAVSILPQMGEMSADILRRLTQEYIDQFVSVVEEYHWNGSFRDLNHLDPELRRVQLLMFLYGLSYSSGSPLSGNINNNFPNLEAFENGEASLLIYDGTTWFRTRPIGLAAEESAQNTMFANFSRGEATREALSEVPTWEEFFTEAATLGISSGISYIPGVPSGVKDADSLRSTGGGFLSLIQTFEGVMGRDITIENVTNSDFNQAYASAISSLGGGIIYTTGPNGVQQVVSIPTYDMYVRLAGFEMMDYSFEMVLANLTCENDPYLYIYRNNDRWFENQERALQDIYEANFDTIEAYFGENDFDFDIDINTPLNELPRLVLEKVISFIGGQ